MRNNITYLFILLFILTIIISCGQTGQLYRGRIYTGKLSDSTFISVKQYLTNSSNSQIKDTIIIKYDYNNETCWDLLDQKEDYYVMHFVTEHKKRVQKVLATRQNVSVFDFREPGQNLNKIKKWDNSIMIDSSKELFTLLFKERCTCGNSIIIMPDKTFIFLRSDSHSEALDYTQVQIEELLAKK